MIGLPTMVGTIRRRMLVNFRVDPDVMQQHLPSRFRPKLQNGYGVAGICLIGLTHIRPKMLPALVGLASENAAHRIAVVWEDDRQQVQEGVFIPRRDTSSRINHLAGGRLFPGEHHQATFVTHESASEIRLAMTSQDACVSVRVVGTVAANLPPTAIFASVAEASAFFEAGSLGYSVTRTTNRLDGLLLATKQWQVEALAVQDVYSSYFANAALFPAGSVTFDHALLMRNIQHEWHQAPDLYV